MVLVGRARIWPQDPIQLQIQSSHSNSSKTFKWTTNKGDQSQFSSFNSITIRTLDRDDDDHPVHDDDYCVMDGCMYYVGRQVAVASLLAASYQPHAEHTILHSLAHHIMAWYRDVQCKSLCPPLSPSSTVRQSWCVAHNIFFGKGSAFLCRLYCTYNGLCIMLNVYALHSSVYWGKPNECS